MKIRLDERSELVRFVKYGYRRLFISTRVILLSALAGIFAGFGAIVLNFLIHFVTHVVLDNSVGTVGGAVTEDWSLKLLLLPFILGGGGVLSGLIVGKFAPEAEGHGTDAAIKSYHREKGYIRSRVPFVKAIASAITIGTGGSGGKEGPIAQIGAGIASYIASRLRLNNKEKRILMCAGLGAGVGAIFRAPIAGAIFAGEVLYKNEDIEPEVIIPSAISSIVAYSVFSIVYGFETIYHIPAQLKFVNISELIPYTILALLCSLIGVFYIKTFYYTKNKFDSLNIPFWIKPAIGACLAGLIGIAIPETISMGNYYIQQAINGDGTILLFFLLIFGKILTTSLTIGSGGSGGVFGPSLVIGGALGGFVGEVTRYIHPYEQINTGAYVIVGMAGFFSGVAKTPISTIIMVSEMTGGYGLLIPALWVSVITFLLTKDRTIYDSQVTTIAKSPTHTTDIMKSISSNLRAKDIMNTNIKTIPAKMTIGELSLKAKSQEFHTNYPVVNDNNEFIGIFSFSSLRQIALTDDLLEYSDFIIADFMEDEVAIVYPQDNIDHILESFIFSTYDIVAVVDSEDKKKLCGIITRKDLMRGYQCLYAHEEND